MSRKRFAKVDTYDLKKLLDMVVDLTLIDEKEDEMLPHFRGAVDAISGVNEPDAYELLDALKDLRNIKQYIGSDATLADAVKHCVDAFWAREDELGY